MMATLTGSELHQKATDGELLSPEDRVVLEQWYAQMDVDEEKTLANFYNRVKSVPLDIEETKIQNKILLEQNQKLLEELSVIQSRFATATA
jgi:hypothetical protein